MGRATIVQSIRGEHRIYLFIKPFVLKTERVRILSILSAEFLIFFITFDKNDQDQCTEEINDLYRTFRACAQNNQKTTHYVIYRVIFILTQISSFFP